MIKTVLAMSGFALTAAFVAPSVREPALLKMAEDRSTALPFDKRPKNLDGTLPGDAGFDPAGFSNNPPKGIWGEGGFKWYRESEIVHGRIAQLAVVGMLFPAIYHFPGNADVGLDAFAELNPYKALSTVPETGLWHITVAIFAIELNRIKTIIQGNKEPGDLGLGQGGWNPFGFDYTPEEYFEKQVQEIKHGRLAMVAIIGELLQTKISGKSIPEQLSAAFSYPDEVAVPAGFGTLGDYFPPNI